MNGHLVTDAGVLILALGLVYGAYRLMQWQVRRDRARTRPPVDSGGATDGSDDDRPPRKQQAR